jgi:hypothetical protein
LGEEFRSLSSSLCSFLHSPVTFFPLGPKYSPEHPILKQCRLCILVIIFTALMIFLFYSLRFRLLLLRNGHLWKHNFYQPTVTTRLKMTWPSSD